MEALFFTACGVGLNRTSGIQVTVIAAKGTLNGATVTAYRLDENGNRSATLGTGLISSATGSLQFGAQSGPAEFEVTGGTYFDEATASTVPMGAFSMRSRLSSIPLSRFVAISPLTEIAVQRSLNLKGSLPSNIDSANQAVSTASNLKDITLLTQDPTIKPSSANDDNAQYGMVLAAISQYALSLGTDAVTVAKAFADDFAADGSFNGQGSSGAVTVSANSGSLNLASNAWLDGLGSAMDTFIASRDNPGFTSASRPWTVSASAG